MNAPTVHTPSWHVYTTDRLYNRGESLVAWAWTAHGPRGSTSGVEITADDAVTKAQCAAVLLAAGEGRRAA